MRAIIVGGGIAGLASALALTQRGWHVEVLERAPEFSEVGAGLSLWPNALRALDALGVGEPVRAPLPDGRIYCYAAANAPEGASDGGLAGLVRRFGGWHDPIPALLDATDPGAVLHHDLYELRPLEAYTSGRVVLTGDAAHAMTPNLGQGACQALEDAVVLGDVLAGGDGLAAYDRQRRSRTQMITRRSRRVGAAAQWASPAAVTLRNTVLRLLPSSAVARSLAPVLDWPG